MTTEPAVADRAEVAPVRPGEELDWERLSSYLRTSLPDLGDEAYEVLQFPNGSANLTYLVRLGGRELVVRRPPFGRLAPGAHDMRREFRALDGLWRHFDRAPRPYLFCDDQAIIGSDFLVVEYRRGVVIWDHLPGTMPSEAGRRIGLAVVDALADLHLLVPDAVGLGDLGRPHGFVERQVSGWRKRWELVDTSRVPAMEEVGRRLAQTLPETVGSRASVLHNDFKIDNCQFHPDDPDRVASIFDWDMATLGDPLVDLGTLLNYWPDPDDRDDDRPLHVPGLEHLGLPSRADVVERYAARSGVDVTNVAWYEAFATWKTAVVLEQLYQRWLRGESTDPRMAGKGEPVARLAGRASALLDRGPG
jgi:aminoglycoside phosphotransferase (APT) family kinase protein